MKKTLLMASALLGALLPAPSALAAPDIAFLNPSGYTSTQQPPVISDVQDADGTVHFVAWTQDTPSNALVEFELKPTAQNAATFTADRVGSDTWEAFVPIPDSFPDTGVYDLTARLYSGVPGNADEVANDTMKVEINQSEVPPPKGETVELSYPDNGQRLGIFVPKGKRPTAVFDFKASTDSQRVRALYTLSDPGARPVWEDSCGAGNPDSEGFGQVRCTLKEGHSPLDVTAVAVVSNKTAPPAPPSPTLDDTGDAHRVLPYIQEPRTVEISAGGQSVELAKCYLLTAFVSDQFDRVVAGANLDVHAEGPEDVLHFGTIGDGAGNGVNETDPFQPPDAGHVSTENAKRCSNNENLNLQGDHNSPGRDDPKHIESVAGTRDNGGFRFALRSDFTGGTFIQAWADVNDDDLAGLTEASGGTQLGWGTVPPEPITEVFLTPASAEGAVGSCVAFEIIARRGGSPYSNGNVDIHIAGPDNTVGFCDVSGGGTRRLPESGEHSGGTHGDGTLHTEGEADSSGRFAFGVTSGSPGTTQVQVWVDTSDDDVLSAEPSRTGTVTWSPPGERTISIASNRSTVRKGRRVTLSGEITGDPSCAGGQSVRIQSRPKRGGRFGTAKTVATDDGGRYSTRIKMRSAKRFRAVLSTAGTCQAARSRTITVNVR